jgi:hypothetical protein
MNSGNLSCIFDNFSLLRPQTITLLFDFKKASARPSPIPLVPPVINTVLLESFIVSPLRLAV